MDSSSEDFEDLNCIEEGDLDNLDAPKKPHFLDYDAAPPTGEELQYSCFSSLPDSSSSRQSLRDNVAANDLDKNNASEKEKGSALAFSSSCSSAAAVITSNVPLSKEEDLRSSLQKSTNLLPIRRRSANEVQPPTVLTQNTGTRKKEFPVVSNSGYHSQQIATTNYHSLDYETVPINRSGDKRSTSNSTNRHVSLDRDLVSRTQPQPPPPQHSTVGMSTSMFVEHGNGSSQQRTQSGGGTWPDAHHSKHNRRTVQEMGPKVECVYSLLSMLGSRDIKVTSAKFLELSKCPDTCTTLRRSGCIPLLVQMIHSDTDSDEVSRKNAAQALHNIVHCHPDDKVGRRESKVLKLIETVMAYCDFLKRDMDKSPGSALTSPGDVPLPSPSSTTTNASGSDTRDRHPSQAIFSLMKISFDEEHRHAMCQLGALQAIAHLVHFDHAVHGVQPKDSRCVSLRRYAGMALTNLTFGDGNNKALLCSNKEFMRALVAQLNSLADDLIQVTASVLRNLSWRADNNMITVLNEIGTVTALTHAAMKNDNMENTLKAILSALWNLSAHCSANKAEFCRVVGALAFLVQMLTYDAPSKTLTIVENAGGILRNVSSHIAVREDYRQVLRERDCLGILLQQLRSESLTIVSNACGTLWNLSARCATDQKYLWENGAVPMLRSLIHSKHKMISNGSNAALKNLLNYRPGNINHVPLDSVTRAMNLKELPSLSIRKQRALEEELDRKLSDTCEIIDMTMSPKREKSPVVVVQPSGRSVSVEQDEAEDVEKVNSKEDELAVTPEEEEPKQQQQQDEDQDDAPVSMNVAPPASMGEQRQQETDFDQITDYSLRYAENQTEQDGDADEEENNEEGDDQFNGNEIILILEDTVKCYEEEGTPYTISSATSMTDLRRESNTNEKRVRVVEGGKAQQQQQQQPLQQQRKSLTQTASVSNSGIQTPENPFKYAEEGTPGCFSTEFSRIGSLSSLEGDSTSPPRAVDGTAVVVSQSAGDGEGIKKVEAKEISSSQSPTPPEDDKKPAEENGIFGQPQQSTTPPIPAARTTVNKIPLAESPATTTTTAAPIPVTSKSVSFIDYAQETPLMFSRTSSLESLSSAEPACVDDVSSVVSEFSRVASGIMSPSELPDSPTQSVPQSPSRRRRQGQQGAAIPAQEMPRGVRQAGVGQSAGRQQSVFEDKLDTFNVENTPAQFSCATSLSNLSILNDEPAKMEQVHEEVGEETENPQMKSDTANAVDSESDAEQEGDDDLLDTCVNMGLDRRTRGELNVDFVRPYYTEDTPAHLSKAASNSDLSVLSMLDNANQCEVIHDDDDEESSSSDDDGLGEQLLQECIANGIEKTISKAAAAATNAETKESAVPMPRRDSLSSLSVDESGDENNFILEEAITAGMNRIRKPEFVVGASAPVNIAATTTAIGNDSMSSMDSCESNDQSNLLFEQCIQSGIDKRGSAPSGNANVPPMRPQKSRVTARGGTGQQHQRPRVASRTVEYHKTDDEALLMECINMGIEKNVAKAGTATSRTVPAPLPRHSQSRSERENINSENILARQNQDIMRRIERMTLEEKFGGDVVARTRSSSKNANGASVAMSESCADAAPGITTMVEQQQQQQSRLKRGTVGGSGEQQQGQEAAEEEEGNRRHHQKCRVEGTTGAPRSGLNSRNKVEGEEQEQEQDTTTATVPGIINSINGFDDGHALEQSNEYPALKSTSASGPMLMLESSGEKGTGSGGGGGVMLASNEYMVESVNRTMARSTGGGGGVESNNKHKDPVLMLKSVDRLTHVLVTTAEFLRSHPSNADVSAASSSAEVEAARKRMEESCDGTWNDNTCPNGDVSFPSASFSPPQIDLSSDGRGEGKAKGKDEHEVEDDNTITVSLSLNKVTEPPMEMRGSVTNATDSQPAKSQKVMNSRSMCDGAEQVKGTVRKRNVKVMDDIDAPMPSAAAPPVINFEIGGQVKSHNTATADPFNFVGSITSLDLDDVQPPSEMEGISYMTTTGINRMDSPQMSSIRNRRGLPSTLVARRAIAGHAPLNNNSLGHGLMKSVESVNSHTNLENVAPPSLMDELLDSMISVDSITSEVASDPLKRTLCGHNLEVSHYETALSDNEDTMTLRSCHELPLDGGATSSNCSSNQSTPVKKRQGSITPKMKREMAKERFKTYTVKVPEQVQVVPSTVTEVGGQGQTPTPEKGPRMSAKQRRQENRSRFQTQILDYSEMKIFEIAPKVEEGQEGAENTVAMETEENPAEEEEVKKTTTTVIRKTLMKLIKPGFVAEDTNKTATVRGRRKPDYVSPYRRPTTGSATASANQSPTHKSKLAAVNNSKVGITPGVTKQEQPKKSGLISKLKQVTKKSPTKEAKEKPGAASKELNRQGTFTKDEPSNENIPKVNSLPATPTKRLATSSSKLPLVGVGVARKSGSSVVTTASGIPRNGLMKRQISAPAAGNILGEKRKSMIAAPPGVKSSMGQLSERSTSTASIKSSVSSVVVTKTPNRPPERKLPLSMPTSRSNSTVGTPRTPTTTFASKISLYGRAKGLIPVTLAAKK